MLYYLHLLYRHEPDSWRLVFNLFRYVTFRSACAAATAFLVTVLMLPWLIRRLKALEVLEKAENPDSEELSRLHRHKNGTPTMGGIGILAGLIGAGLLWADLVNIYVLLALGVAASLGALGFADDLLKLKGGKRGLAGRWKLAFQLAIGLAAGSALFLWDGGPFVHSRLTVPFIKPSLFAPELGALYAVFVMLLIAGSSNAVNLSDGLDGLAAGCSGVAALAYAVLAYLAGHVSFAQYLQIPFISGAEEVTVLCAALGGALLGFLWYNAHPAEVFMGDTGALSIGGFLAVAACVAKQELLLALVGGVFVVEALSVMLQVASFKVRGRRIFRIAPLHHHFQLKGWTENKVVVRLWITAIILALFSVATLKVR